MTVVCLEIVSNFILILKKIHFENSKSRLAENSSILSGYKNAIKISKMNCIGYKRRLLTESTNQTSGMKLCPYVCLARTGMVESNAGILVLFWKYIYVFF